MLTFIPTWNLTGPQENFGDIEARGYNPEIVALTGEFAARIADKTIKSLSVGDIADKRCPERRDLYLRKGIGRLAQSELRKIQKTTWGQKAGGFVEKYVEGISGHHLDLKVMHNYTHIIADGESYYADFVASEAADITGLKSLEKTTRDIKEGDTDWLLKLLRCNGKIELGAKVLHSIFEEADSLNPDQIEFKKALHPKPLEMGITSPAVPDFIIPLMNTVGDIKTGITFEPHFQLTCAGYALSYENEYGKDKNIDWGIIYLLPTRNPSAMVRPLAFAQTYIFALDEVLRAWFLDERNNAYRVLSLPSIPGFPKDPKDITNNCPYCKFTAYCESKGLKL